MGYFYITDVSQYINTQREKNRVLKNKHGL